jgi:hypothetical protein
MSAKPLDLANCSSWWGTRFVLCSTCGVRVKVGDALLFLVEDDGDLATSQR